MGLVQCFVIVLMLSAQLVLTYPTHERLYVLGGRTCRLCPAGEFQKSCKECAPCPPGWYTTDWNRDDSCQPCSSDCRPDFHLKVDQNCTSKQNLKCVCEAGFTCTRRVSLSENCQYCGKIMEVAAAVVPPPPPPPPTTTTTTTTTTPATTTTATTTEAAATNPVEDKHRPSSASPGRSSTTDKPCQFPKCVTQSVPAAGNHTLTHLRTDHTNSQLAAILCPVIAVGFLALVMLIFIRRPGDESCFKQAIALLLCSRGGRAASHKSKESTHQFPRDSFSAKQQPSALSGANLGPVHVHNPGTVIFSLLSQFTGQVGPTFECGKTAERGCVEEEEDERDCPVFHPTSSPSIHLSEEERSGDIDSILFPSQEQGKDCHVSKEEVL